MSPEEPDPGGPDGGSPDDGPSEDASGGPNHQRGGGGPGDGPSGDGTSAGSTPTDGRSREGTQDGAPRSGGARETGAREPGPGSGAGVRTRATVEPGGLPRDAPTPPELAEFFRVTEVRSEGDRVYYFGYALVPPRRLDREVWPTFDEAGYDVQHVEQAGEDMLVARPSNPGIDGIPWTHLLLFVLTVGSTLVAGSMWFGIDPAATPGQIWRGWPFAVGIMTVLGVHELGHYAMARHHRVDATLPYFIPVPTLIGTMGAVIRMKGRMPNRRALFDIGVAGPIAGLVATVVVTVVGLHLDPVTVPAEVVESEATYEISIGFPPLLHFLAWVTGQPLYLEEAARSVHPVVIAGWVGMLVTFLNLIPVGQLDGGHVVRAITPAYQETIGAAVPAVLYALAGYLLLVAGVEPRNLLIWVVWGTVALAVATVGPATPVDDTAELGRRRRLIGAATFVFGLTCFAPVPIAIVG